jgi:hypothetical protein
MAIDRDKALAMAPAVTQMRVDASRLRFFARATGQTDPIYTDLATARAKGHRDLPVSPTFLFGLGMEGPDPFGFVEQLGIDLRTVLHGTQDFTYHTLAYAGDELTMTSRVSDVYTRKGGVLEFIVRDSQVRSSDGTLIAELRAVMVVQNRASEETS